MMNSEVSQIDRIVREVMRRLEERPAGAGTSLGASSGASVSHASTNPSSDSITLRIDDRVVTGDLLSGRLNGVRRIEVRSDAIVTPLVRDLLKEKDVELKRVNPRPDAASRKLLLVEQGRCRPESLLAQLKAIDGQWLPISNWQQLVDSVAAGDSAIVVTSTWAARVCQANRCETVRAVHVVDAASVQQALDQANANLLVVNAEQVDEATVMEIAKKFAG